MTKKDVQKRVLQYGKPLALSKFSWDEKTRTFSSKENHLVLDLKAIDDCTFKTGSGCTFDTGWSCTFNTGGYCTFKTGHSCTFETGGGCTFETGSGCTFDTGWSCTFNTGGYCTFKTGHSCTFETGDSCTFKTGGGCTFETGSGCTFDTGDSCTFNTGWSCTISSFKKMIIDKCCKYCVFVVRDDNMRIYTDKDIDKNKLTLLTTEEKKEMPKAETKLIDGSIMALKNKRTLENIEIYQSQFIIDYFENDKKQFVAIKDGFNAHGETVKEAVNDLLFKIAQTIDKSEHVSRIKKQGYIEFNDYRLLTGSCSFGVREYCDRKGLSYNSKIMLKDLPDMIKGEYGSHEALRLLGLTC